MFPDIELLFKHRHSVSIILAIKTAARSSAGLYW